MSSQKVVSYRVWAAQETFIFLSEGISYCINECFDLWFTVSYACACACVCVPVCVSGSCQLTTEICLVVLRNSKAPHTMPLWRSLMRSHSASTLAPSPHSLALICSWAEQHESTRGREGNPCGSKYKNIHPGILRDVKNRGSKDCPAQPQLGSTEGSLLGIRSSVIPWKSLLGLITQSHALLVISTHYSLSWAAELD